MSNQFFVVTGALVLNQVTPVIHALFGDFGLIASCPAPTEPRPIRRPTWDDVLRNLTRLADDLSIRPGEGALDSIASVLLLLSAHFRCFHDAALVDLIENHRFEGEVDLDTLFVMATRFNDGHGLTAIRLQGGLYCSTRRLFAFRGPAVFIHADVFVRSESAGTLAFGDDLRAALRRGDLTHGADRLAHEVLDLLGDLFAALPDELTRRPLRKRLAHLLVDWAPDIDDEPYTGKPH